MIELWMIFIFLFVFSIFSKFPQRKQKTKYVFEKRETFSFFSSQGLSLLYF